MNIKTARILAAFAATATVVFSLDADPTVSQNIAAPGSKPRPQQLVVVPGTTAVSCEISPCTAAYTGVTADGIGVFINTLWKSGEKQPVMDSEYFEIAERKGNQFAESLESIGDVYVVTKAVDLRNGSPIILAAIEVFNATGPIAADECLLDTRSNKLLSIEKIKPFVDNIPANIAYAEKFEIYAEAYVREMGSDGRINDSYFNSDKEAVFLEKKRMFVEKLILGKTLASSAPI